MTKTNKIIIGVIIAIIIIGGIWYGVSRKPEEEGTIKIGVALSLTGKLASFGQDLREGIEMAVQEVNQEKDFKIKIIIEDTQSDATKSVNVVKKLIEIDNVNIIIGPLRSGNVLATAPIAEENKVILFTPIASAVDITYAGDYIFRNRETSELHGKKVAEFLINKNIKRAATLTAQAPNSKSYAIAFEKEFKERGGEIVSSIEYEPDSIDFRTDITKSLNKNPEAIYLSVTTGTDAGILVKQIRELGFERLIGSTGAVESEEFLNGAGDASEGVFFSTPAFNIENPEIASYRKKYKELYGKESSAFAANAYDAVKILANAIESCGGAEDTDCIKNYLYNLKDYPGIGGKTTFDENGDVIKPIQFKIVKNGEFVPYEE